MADRIGRLVEELGGFYERAGGVFVAVQREAHLLKPLREWRAERDRVHRLLVREALGSADADERVVQVVQALTGFAAWNALVEAGSSPRSAREAVHGLVLCWLSGAAA